MRALAYVTLLAGVLFNLDVNAYLVDAIIGLSVVYKAFDNLGGFKTLFGWQPDTKLAVLGFGLVHGFGLATKLQALVAVDRRAGDGTQSAGVAEHAAEEVVRQFRAAQATPVGPGFLESRSTSTAGRPFTKTNIRIASSGTITPMPAAMMAPAAIRSTVLRRRRPGRAVAAITRPPS